MTKRWKSDLGNYFENEEVDNFIEELIKLYKKHRLSISHEDNHGAFIISSYSKENEDWIREAHLGN